MTFQDWISRLARFFFRGNPEGDQRPDGGTSCYRPVRRKNRDEAREMPSQEGTMGNVPENVSYIHTGFTGMNPPMDGVGQQSGGFSPQQGNGGPLQDNISYMPGVYAPDAGNSFTHVEHVMVMTSLKSCYEAIECMKNGETLILTLDMMANDSESMRCQDMLAGAAFTLGCHVRVIQGGQVILIAPDSVKILPEETPVRPMSAPTTWGTTPPVQEPAYTGKRERRTSRQGEQWTAARNGELQDYNPYTGTTPVAAGEYRSFGGFGY